MIFMTIYAIWDLEYDRLEVEEEHGRYPLRGSQARDKKQHTNKKFESLLK